MTRTPAFSDPLTFLAWKMISQYRTSLSFIRSTKTKNSWQHFTPIDRGAAAISLSDLVQISNCVLTVGQFISTEILICVTILYNHSCYGYVWITICREFRNFYDKHIWYTAQHIMIRMIYSKTYNIQQKNVFLYIIWYTAHHMIYRKTCEKQQTFDKQHYIWYTAQHITNSTTKLW